MAEKSQNLKAYEDMKKRREDPKTEKAIIKEGLKSRYGKNEPPMKRERTEEGFKARRKAKQKDILGKVGKTALSTLGKIANPISGITKSISKLRNKKNKADFQKGDYSDIKIKGGTAKLKGGGMSQRGLGRAFMKGGKV